MRLEVLVATMHQTDYSLLEEMNIQSNAIVINQCDNNGYWEIEFKNHKVIWVNTCQRGLSKSRNMAMSFATADICLIADDDVVYFDGYEQTIISAFNSQAKADVLTFNFERINASKATRKPRTCRKAPFYRSYASVSLAFKRIKIVKNGIHFNELIGAGSDYGAGEESLFLLECRRKKLQLYEDKHYICSVDFKESTWFSGCNEKFYFDTGIYLGAAYGKWAKIYALYYVYQSKKISKLTQKTVALQILNGIKTYKFL